MKLTIGKQELEMGGKYLGTLRHANDVLRDAGKLQEQMTEGAAHKTCIPAGLPSAMSRMTWGRSPCLSVRIEGRGLSASAKLTAKWT